MPSLTATYAAPSASDPPFTHELPPLPAATDTPARTAYLAALQSATKALQDDINAFLTQKMADDKTAADAKEEENYGEEVVDAE
ncbi:hypothetical protein P171DRAFT_430161 [Karstenula rhodostoma CBS 690.94]|uniref:EKC/KEOPS complex subunit GON7 n=1 Tax=Karstenula rhodostoma CBS 690.94 TaxID=1392251 RepID=A0A9P4PNJ8_9PLEO|nr:hypothetical protein P171DRAFT_430161 [Karstenula rhodostoma CBS 690.94]